MSRQNRNFGREDLMGSSRYCLAMGGGYEKSTKDTSDDWRTDDVEVARARVEFGDPSPNLAAMLDSYINVAQF